MKFEEIKGNLIALAKQGKFDVITHGCNCFCTMGAGIAPQMAQHFDADKFIMERHAYKGDFNKLGVIDFESKLFDLPDDSSKLLFIVNSYTQYGFGRNHKDGSGIPLDYDALTLCLRKINHQFKGKHIGLPLIGCGLAGGDWNIVRNIMINELKDMDVTVVHFQK